MAKKLIEMRKQIENLVFQDNLTPCELEKFVNLTHELQRVSLSVFLKIGLQQTTLEEIAEKWFYTGVVDESSDYDVLRETFMEIKAIEQMPNEGITNFQVQRTLPKTKPIRRLKT